MKFIELDENEFDSPSSEERLVTCVAVRKEYEGIGSFVAEAQRRGFIEDLRHEQYARQPFGEMEMKERIVYYLRRFANVMISKPESAHAFIIRNDQDLQEVLIESDEFFIYYSWESTA